MSNIVLNWTPDNLINVGIVFGFFLGLLVSTLSIVLDQVFDYFKNKKREKR